MNITLIRYSDIGNINTRLPESLNKVQGILPPLGLAYIAAALEVAGFDVDLIDMPAMGYSRSEVAERLRRNSPALVGVTAMTSTFFGALDACRLGHECGALTVMGGVHLEVFPKETLAYDYVDFGIAGDGEQAIVRLAAALRDGTDYRNIPGLIYKSDGHIFSNPGELIENLDTLQIPARHLLPNNRYSSIIGRHPVTTMIASRGCRFKCHFCFKQKGDIKVRFRSPSEVVREMRHVKERYGVREIMFYDDTLTFNRKFVFDLCEQILRTGLNVEWEAPSRADCVDREMLKLMKQAHCCRLRYGVESGDQNILNLMNKKITLERFEETFRLTKDAGIETFAYFIIGYITETPETIGKTIRFARRLRPDLVMFTIATPYPETGLFQMAKDLAIIDPNYWHDFVLGRRKDRLPYFVPDAEAWIRRAYHKIYFDPLFILNRARKIRGIHDVLNAARAWRGLTRFAVPHDCQYETNYNDQKKPG